MKKINCINIYNNYGTNTNCILVNDVKYNFYK